MEVGGKTSMVTSLPGEAIEEEEAAVEEGVTIGGTMNATGGSRKGDPGEKDDSEEDCDVI